MLDHEMAAQLQQYMGMLRRPLTITASRPTSNSHCRQQANPGWCCDFMADALWSGRRFRTFNVIDEFNRWRIDTARPSP